MKKSEEKNRSIIFRKILDNKLFVLGIFLMVSICILHAVYEKKFSKLHSD